MKSPTIDVAIEESPEELDLGAVELGLVEHAVQAGIEPRNYRTLTGGARARRRKSQMRQ